MCYILMQPEALQTKIGYCACNVFTALYPIRVITVR